MASDSSTTGIEQDVANRFKAISGPAADGHIRQGATGSLMTLATSDKVDAGRVQDGSVPFSRAESSSASKSRIVLT